jgi:PAS domain S-box-containing protein
VTTSPSSWPQTEAIEHRAAFEAVPALVFITNASGSNCYTNSKFQDYTGLSYSGLLGDRWLDVLHPDDRVRAAEIWQQAINVEEPYEAEYRFRAVDAEYRWHLCRATPSRSAGRITHWIGICIDIDDRQQAKAIAATNHGVARASGERQIPLQIDEAHDTGLILLDPEGVISTWNAGAERVNGWTAKEAIGQHFRLLFVPEDRASGRPEAELAAARRDGLFQTQEQRLRTDGSVFEANVALTPLIENDGRVRGFCKVTHDITVIKRQQREVRKAEERYRLATSASSDAIWDWDLASGRVQRGHPHQSFFGWSSSTMDGVDNWWSSRVHPEDRDRVVSSMDKAIVGALRWSDEYRFQCADGRYVEVIDHAMIVRDPSGKAVRMVGTLFDITAQKAEARRHAYFADIEHHLRSAPDATAALTGMCERLGRHLGATWVGLGELREDGEHSIVASEWRASDMPSTLGRHWLADFGADRLPLLLAGAVVRVEDMLSDPRRTDVGAQTAYASLGVRASLDVPLIRDGQPCAFLFVAQNEPRRWTDSDISLARETLERAWDTAERARVERDLVQSEARMRSLVSALSEIVWTTDADCRSEESSAWATLTGMELPATIGHGWLRAIHRDDRQRISDGFAEASTKHSKRYVTEYRVRCANGQYRWFKSRGVPILDADGRIVEWVGVSIDIDDRRNAEKQLRSSEERFRTLADSIPALIFIADASGGNSYTNPQFHEYCGLDGAALSGAGWLAVVDDGDRDRVAQAWMRTQEKASRFESEFRMRRADGVYRTFLVRSAPIVDAAGAVVQWVGTGMDIQETVDSREALAESRRAVETANAALEARVTQRTAELTRANQALQSEIKRRETMQERLNQSQKLEALGQLTSGIAHDFNNILAAIAGGHSLIEKRTDDGYIRSIAEHCQAAAFRGAKLVKQMLAFARQEVLAPRAINVSQLAVDLEPLVRQAIPGTIINVDIAPGLPNILIDPVLLEAALLNLAVNARDAMPGGGKVTISGRVSPANGAGRPAELSGRDAIAICVRDTGEGMPPEVLQRVIEPFFTTKPPGKGTGLGLAMVHGFVLQSGGAMQIESRVGVGTAITLYLPCAEGSTEVADEAEVVLELEGEAKGSILLVDDDVDVCAITAAQLRDVGYVVNTANDMAGALAAIADGIAFDFVLTDVVMPGGDGITLAQNIRAQRRDVPILFMTGRADSERVAGELVLQKPFTTAALVSTLNTLAENEARERDTRVRIDERIESGCLKDMLSQWEDVKLAGRIPDFATFDIEACSERERLAVIEVDAAHVPMRLVWRHLGIELEQALGRPLVGSAIDVRGTDQFGSIEGSYRKAHKSRQPVYDYAKLRSANGITETIERVVLPYSSDGRSVDRLVSVVFISKSTKPDGAHDDSR